MKQDKIKTIFVFLMAILLGLFLAACDHDGGDGGDDSDTTTTTHAGGGINPSSCIPCGDLILACPIDCKITGCPVCMDFDTESGQMKMVYEDGSYYIVDNNGRNIRG